MNGIVFITTPGAAKRDFINKLHQETGGKVDLVIIQKPKPKNIEKRVVGFIKKVGIRGLPRELFFLLRLFFSKTHQDVLHILKGRTEDPHASKTYLPKTLEVATPNTDEVRDILRELAPRVIAIWGGTIIKPDILNTAANAVNIHTGWCPYYRGAGGNQNAILENDLAHIGITIHLAISDVDAGDILAIIPGNATYEPRELFRELNDHAETTYRDIIKKILAGEPLPATPQDTSRGKNYKLRDWTYEKQFKLADKLLCWEGDSNSQSLAGTSS